MQPLEPGTVLADRYRIVRLIEFGGMGAVYEAEHGEEDDPKKVALKVLHGLAGVDEARLALFRREAKATAAITHPNIVDVIDFHADGTSPPFLVMELLAGSSLGTLVDRDGSLPIARVVPLAIQVLDALAAAHEGGVLHREVKPDNVFLVDGETPTTKVLDFGIASREGDSRLTLTGQLIGSPAYMPPEQARADETAARSDVYAVGACMIHALTGKLPTPSARLATARPDLPAELTAIVDRALAEDPDDRFATPAAMREALAPFANVTVAEKRPVKASPALMAASLNLFTPEAPFGPSAPVAPPPVPTPRGVSQPPPLPSRAASVPPPVPTPRSVSTPPVPTPRRTSAPPMGRPPTPSPIPKAEGSDRSLPRPPAPVVTHVAPVTHAEPEGASKRTLYIVGGGILFLVGAALGGSYIVSLDRGPGPAPTASTTGTGRPVTPTTAETTVTPLPTDTPPPAVEAGAPGKARTITNIGVTAATGYHDKAALAAALRVHLPAIQACVQEADLPKNGKMSISFTVDALGGSIKDLQDTTPDSFRGTHTQQCIASELRRTVAVGPADSNYFQTRSDITITFEAN